MHAFALSAFEDNYIWVLADAAGNAVIVDPGDAVPVLEATKDGLKPRAVLLTHHHPDHVGGAAELRDRFGARCIGPDDDRIAAVDQRVGDGGKVRIGTPDLEFEVMAVPGHTSSHIAFVGDGRLFCGDTLFSLGCGRLFEGTPEQMLASLDRLAALSPETGVFCGHEYTLANGRFAMAVEPGNQGLARHLETVRQLRARGEPTLPGSIATERALNPFLRCGETQLAAAVARHSGCDPDDRVAVFAALRRWKDGFRA